MEPMKFYDKNNCHGNSVQTEAVLRTMDIDDGNKLH